MTIERPAVPNPDGGPLRIRLDLSYDGAPFAGWATQPGLVTVQGTLEVSLAVLFRRPVRVTVAGRTDAGVHARGQVVHFDAAADEWTGLARSTDLPPDEAFRRRLRGVLNRELTVPLKEAGLSRRAVEAMAGAIEVHRASLAPEGFDARFSALWRRYSYRIADNQQGWDPLQRGTTLWHKAELNEAAMNEAASGVLGVQDFLSFCKPRERATTVRELQEFTFTRREDGILEARLKADAFCHNMVRSLIGGSLLVGTGERAPGWLAERMFARVRDSKSKLAPPHPLVLEEVKYPGEAELRARAEATRARRE
ncbi:tRNA pseudouridine(38-40) synthase TruA [Arthrobacter gandavensis]|uniref:tRNA pseudouridine synthase A n=1 Tax=Arthrobacter gandavensis TaxID=169960 RepID=UPI00188FD2AC|nr:tRNA pseudouridine synthase A [Arthrobacter gandavensis]MBF4993855.1 tRNA pseudouridine(38-40) synthase TruA [Arthrobacter gandavensis]